MIKFFRNIRKKLLTENRFNKYALYAIGEIVLVVIGILIALQINNQNELRKEQGITNKYYQGFVEDLTADRSMLPGTMARLYSFSSPSLKLKFRSWDSYPRYENIMVCSPAGISFNI